MTETPEFMPPQPLRDPEAVFQKPETNRSTTIPPGVRNAFKKVGGNKKARGGPRKLTPTDRDKIEDWYTGIALFISPVKPDISDAIMDQKVTNTEEVRNGADPVYGPTRASICADAWMELAEENDSVRRVILAFVESGAWSKLAMANMPILLAAMPDDMLARVMHRMANRSENTVPLDNVA